MSIYSQVNKPVLRRPVETGLGAAVGVVDELDVGAGAAQPERHLERVEHEVGAHVRRELPADDHPTVGGDHEREVDEPLPAAQVAQVGDPELVRTRGAEVALDEVGPPQRLRIGLRGPPRLATPLRTDDPVGAHQPLHPAARHPLAGPPQRLPHPPVTVGVIVGGVQLADPLEQPLVLDGASRAAAACPLVVGGRRHVQGLADRLDPEALALAVDERAHLGRSWSSSLAKNTLAAFKISFARRSSNTSRRSFRISSRSCVVSRSLRLPLSASACRTRLRSVSGWMPRSAATCAIGRSLSSASRTPRTISSFGYLIGLDMTAKNHYSLGYHTYIESFVETGLAHRLIRQLEQLGHKLNLEPLAA